MLFVFVSRYQFTGGPRLGFCRHGIGSSVSVALYGGQRMRHVRDSVRGTVAIRPDQGHRYGAVGDCARSEQYDEELRWESARKTATVW